MEWGFRWSARVYFLGGVGIYIETANQELGRKQQVQEVGFFKKWNEREETRGNIQRGSQESGQVGTW